jgi:hypothetical protein
MKFTLAAITALVAPIAAQITTPAPTQTGNRFGPGGPWATSDPAKWSSIYNSLVSDGRIPSTLTAAPWPTDGWGPGAGWGPGGGRGGGSPHTPLSFLQPLLPYTNNTHRPRRSRPLRPIQLRPLVRVVHALRLALRALDRLVGSIRMSAYRLAWLDRWAVEYQSALDHVVGLHGEDDCYYCCDYDGEWDCGCDDGVWVAGCGCECADYWREYGCWVGGYSRTRWGDRSCGDWGGCWVVKCGI